MLAAMLMHPVAVAVLIGIATISVHFGAKASATLLARASLAGALLGVFIVAVLLAIFAAYVSPERSLELGVDPEWYWEVLRRETLALSTLFAYVGVIGASIVGVPIIATLARYKKATAPWFIVASLPIPVLTMTMLVMTMQIPVDRQLVTELVCAVAGHALLAFGFSIGAGLPWRRVA